MNPQNTDHRIRPIFIILLACCVAAVLIPFFRHATKPPPSAPVTRTAVVVEPAAVAAPVVVAKPVAVVKDPAPAADPVVEVPPPSAPVAPPAPQAQPVAAAPTRVIPPSALEQQGGLQVSDAWLTMGGTEVEVHYTVYDAQKVEQLSRNGASSYLIDQATGAKIPMAQPPPERVTRPRSRALSMMLMTPEAGGFPPPPYRLQVGRTYAILVPNRGGLLKAGSKVTVDVGGLPSAVLTLVE